MIQVCVGWLSKHMYHFLRLMMAFAELLPCIGKLEKLGWRVFSGNSLGSVQR